MGARATRPVLAAAMGAALLTAGAAADDAGERAFANELRILPAFTAQLEHTVTRDEESGSETARLEMDPGSASFRLRYQTLPIEIWRAGGRVMTVPSGAGKPTPVRAERAGKLAALLFMVGSGAVTRKMDVTLEPHETHVGYVLSPRDEANPIEWIRYEFDGVGLHRASVLERGGELHRIVLSQREPCRAHASAPETEAGSEAGPETGPGDLPAVPTLAT